MSCIDVGPVVVQMPYILHCIFVSMHESTLVHITVIFVRAMRVAVDSARLAVCGPASVSKAKVCEQLLVQVQRVFL